MKMNRSITNNYSALLVDDDPAILAVVAQFLRDGGFSVVTAASGEEAIDILQAKIIESEPFDVVMTDVRMPGISGFELIDRIATIDSAIETIVMTGYDSREMIEQAFRSGAYDYVAKPIDDHVSIVQCTKRAAQASRLVRDNAELLIELRSKKTMLEKVNKQLRQLNEVLHIQANTDTLTELYNRRYLEDSLRNEITRRNRYQDPLSVALIDVDHFKQINDNHGHAGGDIVLKTFSKALLHCARESDIVGRYGGEEFLVILPKTSPRSAMLFAERIRTNIEKCKIAVGDSECPVTVSVGVSGVESNSTALDMAKFVSSADQALYAAKGAGRNCIRLHPIADDDSDTLKICRVTITH